MRIKITLLLLIVLGVGLTIHFTGSHEDIVADYSTREAQAKKTSAEGMMEVMRMLKGNIETGEIEPEDFIRMRKAVAEHNKQQAHEKGIGLAWKELGPDNIGGRTRSIVVVDENTLFAGSVSGGLFRSDNGGNLWYKVPGPFCAIGSMAMTGNGDLYVGGGSQFESGQSGNGGSGFLGNGLWRSTDMGETWEIIEETEPSFMSSGDDWNFINTLEADPLQDDKVWLGGSAGVGYYVSGTDDLVMNSAAADGLTTANGQDIDISDDGSVYLVVQGAGRVYVSHDQGQSFELKNGSGGLPNSMSRARVSVSDVDPNYCYALFTTGGGAMGGAWYSLDAGETWTEKWPGGVTELDPMGSNTQGFYDLALCADPENPAKAYVGGVTFWHYGPDITPAQIAFTGGGFGFGDLYVHADVHEIVNGPNGEFYIGTDGGIFISDDNGQTYYAANRGYTTTQFYGIGISSGEAVAGGTQDNSTIVIPRDGSLNTLEEGFTIIGGDGFYTEIAQATGGINMIIGTSQFGRFERYDENGGGGPFYDLNMQNQALNGQLEAGGFYTTIALFEDTEDPDSQQFTLAANPTSHDITDTTLTVYTNNLNIPYDYVIEEGDTLHFWESLERPAFVSDELITEDPVYFWLDVQPLDSIVEVCEADSTFIETVTVVVDSIPVELCDTLYSEELMQEFIVCDTIDWEYVEEDQDVYDYFETCFDQYYYGADIQYNVREVRRIVDSYTSMFVIGFTGSDGIWLTREALNFGVTPHWYRIVDNAPGGFSGTKRFEFTQTGNDLFYCGWGPTLYRVSNLDSLWTAGLDSDGDESYVGGDVDSLIHYTSYANAGGTITGIASDPNNPEHLIISIGGYGVVGSGKLQETWNALDEDPTWENIWFSNSNELARMPLYDVLIDVTDPTGASIVVGTEFGVYTSDDGGDTWTQENDPAEGEWTTGLDACPVFEIRQQKILEPMQFREPTNSGVIYAGTHGRGIFASLTNAVVNVEDYDFADENSRDLVIFPNPVHSTATLDFELLAAQNVIIDIYDIHGKLIESITRNNLINGQHQIQLDLNDLPRGNYLVHLNAGSESKVGQFVKM